MDLSVRIADPTLPADATALRNLLDAYARDPMGGGAPLPREVLERLPSDLFLRSNSVVLVAALDGADSGLAIAFEGYSTFAARPLLNLHDFVVAPAARGRGVAQALLQALEREAVRRGCCKLTLEVLENNHRARAVYAAFGFAGYELDPAAGRALFLQKKLGETQTSLDV